MYKEHQPLRLMLFNRFFRSLPSQASNPSISEYKNNTPEGVCCFYGRDDRIRTCSRKRCKHRLRQSGGCPHSLAFICLGQIKSNRSGMAMQDAAGSFLRIEKERGRHSVYLFLGRDDRIRTCGLCVPNAALYQAEPHLEANYLIIRMKWYFVKSF